MSGRIAIVGGGLAGSITALHLARAGREVVLLEKSDGPHHKVCGEFLSHEALHYLNGAGIDPEAHGASTIRRVRLVGRNFSIAAPLPFQARSLSRYALDECLLQRAASEGANVQRGTHVTGITRQANGWTLHCRNESALEAETVILATGKHDLHGLPRPAGTHNGLLGFKMLFQLGAQQQRGLHEAVELTLFPGGYAGLQTIENGTANLCLLITAAQFRQIGGNWPALLQHLQQTALHLAKRLYKATPLLLSPLSIAAIPYGFVQRNAPDGLWRIGDQAAVIPSFSGDGMAIALHSGTLAAHLLCAGVSADSFQQTLAAQLSARIRFATRISRTLVNQPWLAHATRLWPHLLTHLAHATRIPSRLLIQPNASCTPGLN